MSGAKAAKARQANPNRRKEIAWILYDVGNSAFTLLVSTVLPIYFNYLVTSAGLAATDATAIWGYAASAVTLCVAVLSPILGSFADDVGRKKPLFFFSAILGVLGCGALGIPMGWVAFLAVFIVAKICYSVSLVFYDAMLTDVTTPERLDDVSAKGYAFGYVGSCIPFLLGIYLINFTDLAITVSMPVACLINALWWFGFTLPLTKEYEQTHFIRRAKNTVRGSFKRLFSVFGKKEGLPNRKGIILFLVAFFLYIDGVYTVIDMATSFGTALGFDTTSLLLALLLTQIVAFPAAIVFGKLASKVHNDLLIFICIVAYTGVGIFAVFMTEGWQFWVLACVVGLFQGGVQALALLLRADHPRRTIGPSLWHPRYLRQGRGVHRHPPRRRRHAGDGLRQHGRAAHRGALRARARRARLRRAREQEVPLRQKGGASRRWGERRRYTKQRHRSAGRRV